MRAGGSREEVGQDLRSPASGPSPGGPAATQATGHRHRPAGRVHGQPAGRLGRGHRDPRGGEGDGVGQVRQPDLAHGHPRLGQERERHAVELVGGDQDLAARVQRRGDECTAGVTCCEHGCSPARHGGLSPKTVRNVHGVLHRALQEAAERGHVPRKVASLAHPPTAKQARSDNTRDKSWDAATLARFLTHIRYDRLHAAWRLAGTTGARRGGILGLRWSDVDLDAGTVTFGRQTVTVVTGQLIWQQDGKTDAASSTVALDDQTLTVLAGPSHDERQLAGLAWIDDPHGLPLVFTDPLGRPLRPDSFYRTFVRLTREIGCATSRRSWPPPHLRDRSSYARS